MSKKKGFDIIAEAHERANNNINPYYWFNRVTHFQITTWQIQKRIFSPILFLMSSIAGYAILTTLNDSAKKQGTTFLSILFDFSDSETTTFFISFLFLFFFWIVAGIGTIQTILFWLFVPATPKSEIKREKKKKHPKRPKNYK